MLFLLDASAVLNDFGFQFRKQHSYLITNLAFSELRDIRSRNLAANALRHGGLKIRDPLPVFVEKARVIAVGMEQRMLSEADFGIVGLALEMQAKQEKFVLITDDHAIQLLCKQAGIQFQSIMRGAVKTPKKGPKASKNL